MSTCRPKHFNEEKYEPELKSSEEPIGKAPPPPGSIFRETPLRYLGYMGHLGWICHPILPYSLTGLVTMAYVCADTFVRTSAAAGRGDPENDVLTTAADSAIWHLLATVAIPGIFVHGISNIVSQFQSKRSRCCPRPRFNLLPCALGALALPLISRPIDNMVDEIMNKYFRKKPKFIGGGDDTKDPCAQSKESKSEKSCFSKSGSGKPCLSEKIYGRAYGSGNMTDNADENECTDYYKAVVNAARELSYLELERYYRGLQNPFSSNRTQNQSNPKTRSSSSRDPKTRSSSSRDPSNSSRDQSNSKSELNLSKAIQVDKYDRPPKPKKQRLEDNNQPDVQ